MRQLWMYLLFLWTFPYLQNFSLVGIDVCVLTQRKRHVLSTNTILWLRKINNQPLWKQKQLCYHIKRYIHQENITHRSAKILFCYSILACWIFKFGFCSNAACFPLHFGSCTLQVGRCSLPNNSQREYFWMMKLWWWKFRQAHVYQNHDFFSVSLLS